MSTLCLIILNYHAAEKTAACIDSLRNEPIDTIYILDNSACHNEETRLQRYLDTLKHSATPQLKLLSFGTNLGFAKGVNRVLAYDKTCGGHSHYCLLNNDVVVQPGFILPLLESLYAGNSLASPLVKSGGRTIKFHYYNRLFGAIFLERKPLTIPYLSGCCLMFSRELLNNGPLFDEAFFMYGEDAELCWRLHKSQAKLAVADTSAIHHHGSASSRAGSFFYEYHLMRAHLLLADRMSNHPLQKMGFLIGRLIFLGLRALFRSNKLRSTAPLKAYILGFQDREIRPDDIAHKN